jgi:hypothetical protein
VSGETAQEMAMKSISDGFNTVALTAQAQQSPNRPLATCIAALLSVALGTSVGLAVPVGAPYESGNSIAAPFAHHVVENIVPAGI